MQLSEAGLCLLRRFEGFRGRAYVDAAGLPTIGYGHRIVAAESFPDEITESRAAELLDRDVRAAELAVRRLVKVLLTQGQFDALVDFVYNLGAGRLAGSTLLARLNANNYEAAAEQLLRWDHSGAEVLAGLKARREAEFALWQDAAKPEQSAA
jgi:lysozyme